MPDQVTFKGDGPLGGIQVVADALGSVKGKVGDPGADPPLRPDGKLNVGAAVGQGTFLFMSHTENYILAFLFRSTTVALQLYNVNIRDLYSTSECSASGRACTYA